MARAADDWRWPNARSHIAGRAVTDDPLTDVAALGRHAGNWQALLALGLEGADDPATVAAIEARSRTGRLLADLAWITKMEARIGRAIAPARRGPKPKLRPSALASASSATAA